MASTRKFEEFSEKYTKTGHAGQWLLNNFYGTLASLISNADLRAGVALEVGAGQGYSTSYLRDALHKNVTLLASDAGSCSRYRGCTIFGALVKNCH